MLRIRICVFLACVPSIGLFRNPNQQMLRRSCGVMYRRLRDTSCAAGGSRGGGWRRLVLQTRAQRLLLPRGVRRAPRDARRTKERRERSLHRSAASKRCPALRSSSSRLPRSRCVPALSAVAAADDTTMKAKLLATILWSILLRADLLLAAEVQVQQLPGLLTGAGDALGPIVEENAPGQLGRRVRCCSRRQLSKESTVEYHLEIDFAYVQSLHVCCADACRSRCVLMT